MTDQEYIEAFRQNNQKTIAAYYEQHRDQFCAWLGNTFHTLDIDLLSDVYIESVTRLWRLIKLRARKGQSVKGSSISMVLNRWRATNRIEKISETTWKKL